MTTPDEQWVRPGNAVSAWVAGINRVRTDAPRRVDALYAPGAEASLLVRFGHDGAVAVTAIGPLTRARRKSFASPARTLRVVLRAGRARAVLGAPLHELADQVVPLDALWGSAGVRLRDALAAAGPARALELVESAIATCAGRDEASSVRTALLDRALRALDTSTGRVTQIATALGVSERQLRRVFHEDVGMTPKHYARIARLRRVLAPRDGGWAMLARDEGYYDQSHLIREFRDLLHLTPQGFRHLGHG